MTRRRWTLALLLSVSVLTPALGGTRYVRRVGGNDTQCNGTVDQTLAQSSTPSGCPTTVPAGGCDCAVQTIDACDAATGAPSSLSALVAGDTCSVADGNYGNLVIGGTGNETLRPTNSGTNNGNRITYVCPGLACKVSSINGPTLDLTSRSWITVDGFTFDGGPLGGSSVRPWGGTSQGNILKNFKCMDSIQTDNTAPQARVATIETTGGTNNTAQDGQIQIPYQLSGPSGNAYLLSIAAGTTLETGSLIQNVSAFGWWNGMFIGGCLNCTLDGVSLGGNKNHELELGTSSAGAPPLTNLTIKNSKIKGSVDFREQFQTRGLTSARINGLTLLNNVFTSGWRIPSSTHECSVTGTIKARNNVFTSFDTSSTSGKEVANVKAGGFEGATACTSPAVTYDFDYNVYAGANNFGASASSMTWSDDRGVAVGTGVQRKASAFASGWKGITDTGSVVVAPMDPNSFIVGNTDYRTSTGVGAVGVAGPMFGASGPVWAGMIECRCDSGISPLLCPSPTTDDVDADGTLDVRQYFWGRNTWLASWQVGDLIEWNQDGVARQVLSKDTTGATGVCEARVKFDPPLNFTPGLKTWFMAYGAQDPDGDGTRAIVKGAALTDANRIFEPVSNSVLRDTGSPASAPADCGHAILGTACDVGPVEFDGGAQGPPTLALGLPSPNPVTEGQSILVPVSLSAPATGNVTVGYTFTNGTATGGAAAAGAASGTVLGTTSEAHSVSRSHSRKMLYDAVNGRWYAFWLTGGGTGTATYAHSTDGVTFSAPVSIDTGQGIGFTSFTGQFVGTSLYILMRNSSVPGNLQDELVVRQMSVSASTGALTIVKTRVIHYCGAGSTPTTSTCATATGTSAPRYYGDFLYDDQGYFWVAAHTGDQTSSKHVEIIRSTNPNSIDTWGSGGCDGTVLGACNGSWVTPSASAITWGQGESGTTLVDPDSGASVLVFANDRGTASAPSVGQIVVAKNATGSATGWGAWLQLTANLNQYPNSGTSGADATREDDRRDTLVVDRATGLVHVAYVYRDTGTSLNASTQYFTFGSPYTSLATKTNDSTIIAHETDGLQMAIDNRSTPAKLYLAFIENNDSGPPNRNYVLKVLQKDGANWPDSATAATLSLTTGGRQYPQIPETIENNKIVVMDQEGSSNPWSIVAHVLDTCPSGVDWRTSPTVPPVLVAGQTSGTILIPTCDDPTPESLETASLAFSVVSCDNSCPVTIGTASQSFSITDNDTTPTVAWTVATSSPLEGSVLTLTARLSNTSQLPVTVPFVLSGTATGGGVDYTASASPITIPAGSLDGTATFTITSGDGADVGETIIVDFGTLVNATAGAVTRHTATIQDTEPPACTFSWAADVTASEGDGTIRFHATRTTGTGTDSVQFSTVNGTALGGTDFTAITNQVVSFGSSVTDVAVDVTLAADDASVQGSRAFTVVMNTPGTCTIADGTATGTITDNDTAAPSDVQAIYGAWIYGMTSTGGPGGFVPLPLGSVPSAPTARTCSVIPPTGTWNCFGGTLSACAGDGGTIPDLLFELRVGNPSGVPLTSATGTVVVGNGGATNVFASDAQRSCIGGSAAGASCTTSATCTGGGTCGTQLLDELMTLRSGTGAGNQKRVIEYRWGGVCRGGSAAGTGCLDNTPCTGGGTCDAADGWFRTTDGRSDGMRLLSCRYATLADYISQHYVVPAGGAMCVSGSSSGGTQQAFALSTYGLQEEIDAALFVSSPFNGDPASGCDSATATTFCADPVTSCASTSKGFPTFGQTLLNASVGIAKTSCSGSTVTDRRGGCCNSATACGSCTATPDTAYTAQWAEDSAINPAGDYDYSVDTKIKVLLGDADTASGAPYGARLWLAHLLASGMDPALLSTEDVPGAPHECLSLATCAAKLRTFMQTECVPR